MRRISPMITGASDRSRAFVFISALPTAMVMSESSVNMQPGENRGKSFVLMFLNS